MLSRIERYYIGKGLLFISPWLIGFLLFNLYPLVASFYYSFTSYNVLSAPEWVGTENYRELFFKDSLFFVSLKNTLYYVIVAVPLYLIVGVFLAILLNLKIKGMSFLRTMFYIPSIVPIVATAILWRWIFNPQIGLMNALLTKIGLPTIGWLTDPFWAKPSLILMGLWGIGGGMVIYLAGLQDIPQELYDAADVDGANWWQKTVKITIPMISPVIFFNLIMGMIGAFQYFTQAYIMTNGGPLNATLFYSLYLYQNAFTFFKMGYASAQAWILFIIVLLATVLVFKSSAKFVFYQGGELK